MKMQGLNDYIAAGRKVSKDRWYNGFSPQARNGVNQPQRVERYQRGNNPTVCSITGYTRPDDPKGAGYMFTHLEDYSIEKSTEWLPVSKLAHRLLHARFVDPRSWFDFVARNYKHGAWWTMLVMSPVKMYRSYDEVYPVGLPKDGEFWEAFATEAGISRDLFLSRDLRDPIRFFWGFPEVSKPKGILPSRFINPPKRKRA